ncbi:MAG: DNA polymerase III subunit delta [Janthinobacterium lividum]
MKFPSLLPWLQPNIPLVKGILLYGNCDGLISFRLKCLQKIFSCRHYVSSFATSAEEALDTLQALPGLFDSTTTQKNIVFPNVTDAFLNKGKIIDVLRTSRHVLIISSTKLTSRSKLVGAFQDAKETALIPCYDIQQNEITKVCEWLIHSNQLKITKDALNYFINFSMNELEQFFSIFDLLSLYAGQETLDEKQLKNILSNFTSVTSEKFNQHFFLQEISDLHHLAQTFEVSEWIRLIRLLIQDLMILMACHSHHLKASDLKQSWSKGLIKFPYPRLFLYEKALPSWDIRKCHRALNSLLELEGRIKSTLPPTHTQMSNQLIELSRSY